jgi:hypothetical protein
LREDQPRRQPSKLSQLLIDINQPLFHIPYTMAVARDDREAEKTHPTNQGGKS